MKKTVFMSLGIILVLLCMNFVSADVIEQEDTEYELIQEINPEFFKGETASEYVIRLSDDTEMKLCNYVITSDGNYITAICRDLQLGAEYNLIIKDAEGNFVKYELILYENPRMLFIQDNTREVSLNMGSLEAQLYKRDLGEMTANEGEVFVIDGESYAGEEFMTDESSKMEPIGESLIIDMKKL